MKIDPLILADKAAERYDISNETEYPFKAGFLCGIIEEMISRYPECAAVLERRAKMYNYDGN